MKPSLHIVAVVVAVAISLILGFWLGFRQGWQMGLKIEAAPRAVAGMQLGRGLDSGRAADVKYYFESQINAGLMFWHDVSESRLAPHLNALAGADVFPEYETYIRRLAEYRRANPSPLWDPKDMAEVDAYLAEYKPELAEELAADSREAKSTMDAVVAEYAP